MCNREYLFELLYNRKSVYLNDLPAEYVKDGLALLRQMSADKLVYPTPSTSGPYSLTPKGRAAYLSSAAANQNDDNCHVDTEQKPPEVAPKKGFDDFAHTFKMLAELLAALLSICGAVIAFVRLFIS